MKVNAKFLGKIMNHKRLQKLLLGIFAALLTVIVNIHILNAQESSPFYWEFINVNMDVQNNGDMLIKETQKYVFTDSYSNQRYRYILLDKVDKITDVSVTENGISLPVTTKIDNNKFRIEWSHTLNPPESHTFIISYRVIGGLHIQRDSDQDQVYWKAIFPDRSAIIENAKVTVTLPPELAGKIVNFKSSGVSAKSSLIDNRTVEFTALSRLYPKEELVVNITFPHDILNLSSPQWQSNIFSKLISILPFILFILFIFGIGGGSGNGGGGGGGGDGGGGGGGGCGGCGGGG